MRNSRLSGICFFVVFLMAAGTCVFSVPSWSDEPQRDDIVAQALDTAEAPPDAREAYLGQQARYFIAETPADRRRHSFDVGYEIYDYSYRETVEGERFMSNEGNYSGFFVDYVYRPDQKDAFYAEYIDEFRLQARFATGEVDYTGSGTYSGLEDYMYEVRGLMGKRYNIGSAVTVIPYTGIGYRYLNDGAEALPANATTYSGYNRESRYVYLPVGSDLRTRLRNGWALSMNMEYDKLIDGQQQSHLEDMRTLAGSDPHYSNLVNEQKEGFGLRGSVKVAKDINKRVNVFVEPFFRYWDIEDSEFAPYVINGVAQCSGGLCTGGVEPSNVTKEFGIKMGVGF